MANKLDPMDLKQIIRLKLDGYSNRKVGQTLGISRNTVNTYTRLFESCEYQLKELLDFDFLKLAELFPGKTTIDNERYNELMTHFDDINKSRELTGFTFLSHYNEYAGQVKQPYGYTQFLEHYNRKYGKTRGSVKLEHEAGKEIFIDFAGKKLQIVDRQTGEVLPVEVFVAILPCSQYTYVQGCMSQKREDLIGCMTNALSFFEGVTKAIVSDNLKSAVTKASKYEPIINRTFKEFAHHYNCVVNPTRSYSPQDKALVENAVQLAYQRIYYPLRNMTFFSLAELNKEIRKLLDKYNDMLFQRKQASRKELYQSIERHLLKPLPEQPYQLKGYTRAKVQKMGYVYFSPDKCYYSVPYRYISKSTTIHYTQNLVEVYFYHERIASHKRNLVKGSYITNKDHLCSTHKAYMDWDPEYFKRMAKKHGSNVLKFISGLFEQYDYPEIAYKRAMGIIQLHRTYGSVRLDKACDRASYGESYSYNMVKNILEKKLDMEDFDSEELNSTKSHIPRHSNIRGATEYK